MMKIVVLDGYTLNPGDLSWQALEELGETALFERSTPGEAAERIRDADVVLTNKVPLTEPLMAQASRLQYIGVMATGYNIIDLEAASRRHITVTHVPAYSTASVAQLSFALILELASRVNAYTQSVAKGDWTRSKDFTYQVKPIMELQDKTLGIVGFGRIGQAVARTGLAFGMRLVASHKHPERDRMNGVEFIDEVTLFRDADIISLHCPLTDQNRNFVNRDLLEKMKPSALLINTSRGALINEKDLAEALNEGILGGAGLDVLSGEPPRADNPLLAAKNCLITPHIGWATFEARSRLMKATVENLRSYTEGIPLNIVL